MWGNLSWGDLSVIPTYHFIPQLDAVKIITLTLQTPTARTDIYMPSIFPETIRDWDAHPDLIIFSAEAAEDGMARFTS